MQARVALYDKTSGLIRAVYTGPEETVEVQLQVNEAWLDMPAGDNAQLMVDVSVDPPVLKTRT